MKAVGSVFSASKQTAGIFRVYNNPQSDQMSSSTIPLNTEFQLAQDFAFVAAYKEGADAVSAVSITPHKTERGIAVNIAANAGVDPFLRMSFKGITGVLERCARKGK